ncbi:hypothetical protein FGB62_1g336 [Gracilaria domingensis]|nr:hypothetical protein FGB62_1g336 [Gracilaria domingensis]
MYCFVAWLRKENGRKRAFECTRAGERDEEKVRHTDENGLMNGLKAVEDGTSVEVVEDTLCGRWAVCMGTGSKREIGDHTNGTERAIATVDIYLTERGARKTRKTALNGVRATKLVAEIADSSTRRCFDNEWGRRRRRRGDTDGVARGGYVESGGSRKRRGVA